MLPRGLLSGVTHTSCGTSDPYHLEQMLRPSARRKLVCFLPGAVLQDAIVTDGCAPQTNEDWYCLTGVPLCLFVRAHARTGCSLTPLVRTRGSWLLSNV